VVLLSVGGCTSKSAAPSPRSSWSRASSAPPAHRRGSPRDAASSGFDADGQHPPEEIEKLLFFASAVLFLFGLLSEQIAALRLVNRGDD
jgi:hypothetical protein